MKITKVTYQKAYIIGPYLQEKVGFEAELNEFDFEKPKGEILDHLKELADDWHNASNPQLKDEYPSEKRVFVESTNGNTPPTIDYKKVESWEAEIDNCTTINQLAGIKDECWKIGLSQQYIKKFNELNNGSAGN